MQPMNYTLTGDPTSGITEGIQTAAIMGQQRDQADARHQALLAQQQDLKQKKAAMAQQQQMQSDLGYLAENKNPTAQDFAAITTKYPALAEHFQKTWTMLNTDQQQSRLSHASQIYAALRAGKSDIAAQIAADQATAFKNSGSDKDAQAMDTLSQLIKTSPDTASTSTGLFLASIPGGDKVLSTYGSMEKLPGEVAQGKAAAQKLTYEANNTPQRLALENGYTGAQIRNLDSTIADRANRLNLDRDTLQSNTELKLYELGLKNTNLDDGARKLINDSAVAAVSSDQSAAQMTDLADRLEKEGGGYGSFSTASEWYKKATGNQDAMTQMRNEYTRIRSTQVAKMLPPGSASDKDIQIVMSGFPSETADSKTMASFLRGMAKLSQFDATVNEAKAEWVNSVGHLGRPKADIDIGGVKVPAGTTFVDFAKKYVAGKVDQKQTQAAQEQIPSRGYMKWAQPQGAQ